MCISVYPPIKEPVMSLYNKHNTPTQAKHGAEFIAQHATLATISVESASVFLGKAKDSMNTFAQAFNMSDDQKPFTDALKSRHEVCALVKEVKFIDFRHHVISKPESFKGLYTVYAEDLKKAGVLATELVRSCSDKLKLLLSTFINEYKDSQIDSVYGYYDFKDAETKLDKNKRVMAGYFTGASNKVKTTPDEVLKNFTDIPDLYDQLTFIGVIFSKATLTKTNRDVQDLAEMVDALVAHNVTSKILTNNNDAKRQLMECIDITARCVEYHSALYAQALMLCTSFKSLTDALKEMD